MKASESDQAHSVRALWAAAWSRSRRWFAAGAVVAGLASPFLPQRWGYVSLTILLGIIVQTLFTIEKESRESSARRRQRTVRNVVESEKLMDGFLAECLELHQPIEIYWIGMTMYNAWNSVVNVLDRLAERSARDVNIHVAMLTADWLEANPINPEWDRTQAEGMARKINLYLSTNAAKLADLNWELHLHKYEHMPILHGGLINDRYLLFAVSRWDDGCLRAGVRSYEVHRYDDGPYALDRIAVYKDWFAFCAGMKREWYEKNLALRSGEITQNAQTREPEVNEVQRHEV